MKLEPQKARHPQLLYESKLYKILQGGVGIPHIRFVSSFIVELSQLIFCSLSVVYEPIQFIKNWNKPLTKLCLKCPLYLKHMLALH